MTLKSVDPAWWRMSRRAETTDPWDVDLGPPSTLADRYTATARIRESRDGVHHADITLRDRGTGATVTVRAGRVTLFADIAVSPSDVVRLWKDALEVCGLAQRQGRPLGTTTIHDDGEILRVIAELRREGMKVTHKSIVAVGATFSIDELRGYLRVNGKQIRRGEIVPRK